MTQEHSPTQRLGERVKDARKARGWSQSGLAGAADVSRATIARIEAGQDISTATLVKVAAALGLDVALLAAKAE